MTEDSKILLEIRDRTARIEQRLDDRDRQMAELSSDQEGQHARISELERQYAGLKAWITAAGVVGGVIGWSAHSLFPTFLRK